MSKRSAALGKDIPSSISSLPIPPPNLPGWLSRIGSWSTSDAPSQFQEMYSYIEKEDYKRISQLSEHGVDSNSSSQGFFNRVSAEAPEHRKRNRYTDIIPFDHNRVKLHYPSPLSTSRTNSRTHSRRSSAASAGNYSSQINSANNSPNCRPATPSLSDYINASYVSLLDREYISTQGPLQNTIADFWSMVWDQDCRTLVMLTREEESGRVKCVRYWPEGINKPPIRVRHGTSGAELEIALVESQLQCHGEVMLRGFRITRRVVVHDDDDNDSHGVNDDGGHKNGTGQILEQESRIVRQLHYMNWPDHGVCHPQSMLNIILLADRCQEVAAKEKQANSQQSHNVDNAGIGPMVVHCSAGCGRTGTFCVVDSLVGGKTRGDLLLERLHQARKLVNATADAYGTPRSMATGPNSLHPASDLIMECVRHLRTQRVSMVQTREQFVLCYEALILALGSQ
jgi:protein tyrosine phosphatase